MNTYSWVGPGGLENLRFIVVQVGRLLQIINTSIEPYSAGIIYQEELSTVEENPRFSFATVNSELIVATNQPDILIYSYDGSSISKRVGRIKIRDMFGVEDIMNGIDLTEGMGLLYRPRTTNSRHTYNLRNQTWALPAYKCRDRIRDMVVGGDF